MQSSEVSAKQPLIALIAGEESGDQLGADLIVALRRRYPGARLVGIGGTRMAAQEFEALPDFLPDLRIESGGFGIEDDFAHC